MSVVDNNNTSDGNKCKTGCGNSRNECYLKNNHIYSMPNDFLYHLNLGTGTHDLKRMFGDVKFVCMGGSMTRMRNFTHDLIDEMGYELPAGVGLVNIIEGTDRYVMYKIGPVLFVNHGMGIPSMLILLHEVIKLMHHAGCKDVYFFRVGTCGGIGLEPGTVCITNKALDANLSESFTVNVNGNQIKRPAKVDQELVQELLQVAKQFTDEFPITSGTTMCYNDFYEEQCRIDGAFCSITEEQKMEFLNKAKEHGVCNIEMECSCFITVCHHAGIRAGIVAVTLVNRLKGDQCLFSKEECKKWERRVIKLLAAFMKTKLDTGNAFQQATALREKKSAL